MCSWWLPWAGLWRAQRLGPLWVLLALVMEALAAAVTSVCRAVMRPGHAAGGSRLMWQHPGWCWQGERPLAWRTLLLVLNQVELWLRCCPRGSCAARCLCCALVQQVQPALLLPCCLLQQCL